MHASLLAWIYLILNSSYVMLVRGTQCFDKGHLMEEKDIQTPGHSYLFHSPRLYIILEESTCTAKDSETPEVDLRSHKSLSDQFVSLPVHVHKMYAYLHLHCSSRIRMRHGTRCSPVYKYPQTEKNSHSQSLICAVENGSTSLKWRPAVTKVVLAQWASQHDKVMLLGRQQAALRFI